MLNTCSKCSRERGIISIFFTSKKSSGHPISVSAFKVYFVIMIGLLCLYISESGIRYFVNGVAGLKKSEVIQAPVWHLDEFNDFTISKPNSNNRMEEMLPMKIDQLATWGLVLNERTIKEAFNEGRFYLMNL